MDRKQISIILAGVGVALWGPLSQDAVAFARAVETQSASELENFATRYPHSAYRTKAFEIADNCNANWVGGACHSYSLEDRGNGGDSYGG